MSQHGFSSLAASARTGGDLTAILEAIQTSHLGAARPTYVEKGMIWGKEAGADIEVYLFDGASDVLLGAVSGGKFKAATAAIGAAYDVQEFTVSGTWTKPASAEPGDLVIVWGVGGGASGAWGSGATGGNGGSGFLYRIEDIADLGASESVTIGAGGAARTSFSNGLNGGDTVFGTSGSPGYCKFQGGRGNTRGASITAKMQEIEFYSLATASNEVRAWWEGFGGCSAGTFYPLNGQSSHYGGGGGGTIGGFSSFAGSGGGTGEDGAFPGGGGGVSFSGPPSGAGGAGFLSVTCSRGT